MERSTNHRGPSVVLLGLLAGVLALLAATPSDAEAQNRRPNGPDRVFALTDPNTLLQFNGDRPGNIERRTPVTGLEPGDNLVGIDFRPSTAANEDATNQGALYGLGDGATDTLYTINTRTGAATRVADLTLDGVPFQLVGTSFGFDFNPTVNRIRIVSDQDQNLRVNPFTGAIADNDPNTPGTQPDGTLNYADGDENEGENPNVTAAAYRNSRQAAIGTTNTELYDIDTNLDIMAEQTPPNAGTLVTEGSLRVDVEDLTGFDIVTRGASPAGDRGFAALQRTGSDSSAFYSINLDNGRATKIGMIGRGNVVKGLAIPIGQR